MPVVRPALSGVRHVSLAAVPPQTASVLAVDDQGGVVSAAVRGLPRPGLVDLVDERAALSRVAGSTVVLVALDGQHGFGWELLRRLRAVSDVPVLALLGGRSDRAVVYALQAGADDCVRLPAHPDELQARLRALTRRRARSTTTLTDGWLTLDPVTRTATVPGATRPLSSLEFRLLGALLQQRDRCVDSDELLDAVWEDPSGLGEDRVRSGIRRLRESMGWRNGECPIETVHRRGYRYRTPAPGRQPEVAAS